VSKKLPGIRLVPIKLEVGWQTPAEGPETVQQVFSPGFAGQTEFPPIRNVDLDLVAGFQLQGLDNSGGETDGEAIAPFCDLHRDTPGYT
jgi:hypothetical protein